eukprot:scaffold59950_cov14-Tisochrysis_lutea.AAC.1
MGGIGYLHGTCSKRAFDDDEKQKLHRQEKYPTLERREQLRSQRKPSIDQLRKRKHSGSEEPQVSSTTRLKPLVRVSKC